MPRAPDEGAAGPLVEGAAGPLVELEIHEGAVGAALAPEMGEDLASLFTAQDGDDMFANASPTGWRTVASDYPAAGASAHRMGVEPAASSTSPAALATCVPGDDRMHAGQGWHLLPGEGGEGLVPGGEDDEVGDFGQGWLEPSARLPSDASDDDGYVQITHTSNEGKPPSPAAQKQACCVCGGTRELDMLECCKCDLAAHSCCYYQRGSQAEGDAISAGDEWECEDCGGWPQWRPPADPGAPAPRPAD